MRVTSEAYRDGQRIPTRFTCDGEDVAVPAAIEDVPDDARFLAVVFDDPDSPSATWDHWAFWDLPASQPGWPAGFDPAAAGATVGRNSWGREAYGGPCPGSGTHRYVLTVYALPARLALAAGTAGAQVHAAAAPRALATARLTGRYARS